MGFKVQIGNLTVLAETVEEVEALVGRFGGLAPTQPSDSPECGAEADAPPVPVPSGHGVPKKALIRSASKKEAMFKLFNSLTYEGHRKGLRFLATKGSDYADVEEVRAAAGLPVTHRMSGFSSGIWRRCPAFGLEPDDVLKIESPGIVGGRRIYRYRMGPEMIEMMTERGLAQTGEEAGANGVHQG